MYNFDRMTNIALDYLESQFRTTIRKNKADKLVFTIYPERDNTRVNSAHLITNGVKSNISFANDSAMRHNKAITALSSLERLNRSEPVVVTITPSMPNSVKVESGGDVVFQKSIKAAYKLHNIDFENEN